MPNPNCSACGGTGTIRRQDNLYLRPCGDCDNYDWLERQKELTTMGSKEVIDRHVAIRDCLKELVWCKNIKDQMVKELLPTIYHPKYKEYKARADAAWARARELLT